MRTRGQRGSQGCSPYRERRRLACLCCDACHRNPLAHFIGSKAASLHGNAIACPPTRQSTPRTASRYGAEGKLKQAPRIGGCASGAVSSGKPASALCRLGRQSAATEGVIG